jgi:hypothetical protein
MLPVVWALSGVDAGNAMGAPSRANGIFGRQAIDRWVRVGPCSGPGGVRVDPLKKPRKSAMGPGGPGRSGYFPYSSVHPVCAYRASHAS